MQILNVTCFTTMESYACCAMKKTPIFSNRRAPAGCTGPGSAYATLRVFEVFLGFTSNDDISHCVRYSLLRWKTISINYLVYYKLN